MKTYNPSMFDAIKAALNAKEEKNNTRKDILRFTPGNTYTVRLLPNIKNLEKTFLHYYQMGWTSFATGQYISYVSPSTYNERDPVAEERYKINQTGTDAEKQKIKAIYRSEKWLCNAYVVEDPTNAENNGTVKFIRYGKQLHKIIDSAINGEDAAEFGSRVFDLSPNGVNLKIRCEKQGEFPTFVSSRFTSPIDLQLSEDRMTEIYNSVRDVESFISIKTFDEIQTLFKEHYLVDIDNRKEVKEEATKDNISVEDTDPEIEDLLRDL